MGSPLIIGGGDIAENGIIPVVGGRVIPHSECDVRDPRIVLDVMERYRPRTVIVTAGVSRPDQMMFAADESLKDEIDTNLLGAFHVAKYATLAGVKTLIFIASVAGLHGKPNHAGYSASKAGLISLVQSLAHENHNAYAISPGRVDTKMREQDYPGEDTRTRLVPKEIGYVVRDIIDGKYVRGDNLIIRRIGFETQPIEVDKGEPFKSSLRVGLPPAV